MRQPIRSDEELFKAFDYVFQKDFYGGEKPQGGYLIAYSLEFARKLIYLADGHPQWQDIHAENAHIGIAVHDETDLQFIQGLSVQVTVTGEKGFRSGPFENPLLKRPDLQHYGRNWILPGDGIYTLHVKVATPEDRLRNESSSKVYKALVEVVFPDVKIETGQRIS